MRNAFYFLSFTCPKAIWKMYLSRIQCVCVCVWHYQSGFREREKRQKRNLRYCDAVRTKTQPSNKIVTWGIHFQICFFFSITSQSLVDGRKLAQRRNDERAKWKEQNSKGRSRYAKEKTLSVTNFHFSSLVLPTFFFYHTNKSLICEHCRCCSALPHCDAAGTCNVGAPRPFCFLFFKRFYLHQTQKS